MLDHPQNCFCNGNRTCNVSKGCTKAIPQGTTNFPLKSSHKKTMELKGKNKGKRASIFYQVVVILSIHLISGCRTTASIPAFQAGDGGSTPLSRSNGMNLTNSAQQRHRILAKVIPGFCQGLMTVTAQVVQWIMPLLCQYNRKSASASRHENSLATRATLRSYPSVQICHPDHAPHPLHYTYQIAGCMVKIHSAPLPWFYSRPITCRKPESGQNGIQLLRMMNCFGVYLLDIAQ